MKKEQKLGEFKIFPQQFLCDFIFKFEIQECDKKTLFIRQLFTIQKQQEAFHKKAYNHIYDSICYFTNGEKIVSYRKEGVFHELGIHYNVNKFEHYFGENLPTREIYDVDISFKKYTLQESLEKEIYEILSIKNQKRKVLIGHSENNFIETFVENNIGIYLQINPKKIIEFYTNDLLVVSKRFEEKCKPIKLLSCFNCGYFKKQDQFPFGTTNSLHECMLIKQKAKASEFNEAITHIWSYCSDFIEKKNKKEENDMKGKRTS
jgi:hypothetical protein